jgi:uncharacterized PurR-regulated membrane protein YhhQ (DUF165 family)
VLITFVLNPDAGRIATASRIAFAVSNLVDWGIYCLIRKKPWMVRANVSNSFAAGADSLFFPSIAFGAFMPLIVLAQWTAKILGGLVWSWVFAKFGRK